MTPTEVIARAARAETRAATLRVALSQILTHMEEIDGDELDCLAAISDTARRALEEVPDKGLVVVSAEDLRGAVEILAMVNDPWRYISEEPELETRLRSALAEKSTDELIVHVAEHGTYFVTRSAARQVRMTAIGMLAAREDVDSLVLDFAGVEAITNGCADEMVAGLIVRQDDRQIRVANTNDDLAETIATALARRGMTVEGIPERALYAALATCEQLLMTIRPRTEEAVELLRELADPNPCEHFDHHGYCQTHGWLEDGRCAHARARELLAALAEAIVTEAAPASSDGETVTVNRADLDLVMNRAGDPTALDYPAACQRIRDALNLAQP